MKGECKKTVGCRAPDKTEKEATYLITISRVVNLRKCECENDEFPMRSRKSSGVLQLLKPSTTLKRNTNQKRVRGKKIE